MSELESRNQSTLKSVIEAIRGMSGELCHRNSDELMSRKEEMFNRCRHRHIGDPGCQQSTRLHLKVVYTCVPKDVLKELDIGVADNDKSSSNSDILSNEDSIDTSDYTGFVEEPRYVPEHEVSSTPYPSSGQMNKVLKGNKEDLAISPNEDYFTKE